MAEEDASLHSRLDELVSGPLSAKPDTSALEARVETCERRLKEASQALGEKMVALRKVMDQQGLAVVKEGQEVSLISHLILTF